MLVSVSQMDRDLASCLTTIRRSLSFARQHAADGEWNWAAIAARHVVIARITIDRDTSDGDLRRLVSDDDYTEAFRAADEATQLLATALREGATRSPRDEQLLCGDWIDE